MFTTVHPIALADWMARFRFSICWKTDLGCRFIAAGEIGSTLVWEAMLMSLLGQEISTKG